MVDRSKNEKQPPFSNHKHAESIHVPGNTVSEETFSSINKHLSNIDESDNTTVFDNIGLMLRKSATGNLLIFMWIFSTIQLLSLIAISFLPPEDTHFIEYWKMIFTLQPSHIEFIWTWVTNIFSHGSFFHLFINSIVFASFGVIVEKIIGNKKKFIAFFVITGIISSLAQATVFLLSNSSVNTPILGASGAISALLGIFAVKKPNKKVLLFFIIPLPMWVGMSVFLIGSSALVAIKGIGAYHIGHTAHISGAILGISYALLFDTNTIKLS